MKLPKKVLLTWILYLLASVFVNSYQAPHKIIGILSICRNGENTTSEHSKVHQEASIIEKTFIDNIRKKCILSNCILPSHFQYEYHDVCDSQETLVKLFLNLTLHQNYFKNNTNKSMALKPYDTNTLTIFTYLNIEMSTLLASLVKGVSYNWPVLYFNYKFVIPDSLRKSASTAIRSTKEMYIQDFVNLVKFFDWKYVAIICFVRKEKPLYILYFDELLENLRISRVCFHLEIVKMNDKNYNKLSKKLYLDTSLEVIILFGNENDQSQFVLKMLKRYNEKRFKWLVHDVEKTISVSASILSNINYQFVLKRQLMQNIPNYHQLDKIVAESFNVVEVFRKQITVVYNWLNRISLPIPSKWKKWRTYFISSFSENYNTLFYGTTPEKYGNFFVKSTSLFDPKYQSRLFKDIQHAFHSPICPHYSCKPGWEKTFDHSLPEQTQWNYSFGWTCRKCPNDTVKGVWGDSPCLRCVGLTIPNANQTKCSNPYQLFYINISLLNVKLFVCLSVTGIICSITIMGVFTKYRNTPIGRAVDFNMTMLHLSIMLCLFGLIPLTIIGKPAYLRCILQLSTMSVLFSANSSIIVVKSKKIQLVFQSKMTLEKRDVLMTHVYQWIIIFLCVGFSLALISIMVVTEDSLMGMVVWKDDKKLEYFCDMDVYVYLHVTYLILLQLVCFVPAFKIRKLPSVFNEAMSIVYTSFIVMVTFMVMCPIFYFQKSSLDKLCILWVTFSINNLIIMILMYGKKVMIILFHPEQNTKEYFREKTLASMSRKADSIIRH